ncbi:protein sorting system archaetidylserine synthase [Haladaptatus sp.]|uniref:protein sorting system archaetidylserine synthase n=1 Tax=Haladaptatus sp. TaxID=1973141 RepID=UPI003C34E97D
MKPRFVGRLSLADAVTVSNAALGFLAISLAATNPRLAARLVLLGAVADGLDGVLARRYGSSAAGPYLDSLADVASFSVAPAVLVVAVVRETWGFDTLRVGVAMLAGALFVAMAIVRLGLYTAYDTDDDVTEGIPTTLASVILAAGVLAGFTDPTVLVALTVVLSGLMVSTITYPDLLARDALIMGVVHTLAVLIPNFKGRTFPYALLSLALAYLVLSPGFYWRETEGKPTPAKTTEGKRS